MTAVEPYLVDSDAFTTAVPHATFARLRPGAGSAGAQHRLTTVSLSNKGHSRVLVSWGFRTADIAHNCDIADASRQPESGFQIWTVPSRLADAIDPSLSWTMEVTASVCPL